MSPTATPRLRGAIGSARPQWVRAAATHLQVYLFLWVCAWAVVVVGIALALVIVERVGAVTVSVAQFVRDGPLVWFLFAIGVVVVSAYLTPHVANGMTRRSFGRGALLAGTVNGVLNGVTAAAVVLLEGVLYDRMGWTHGTPGDSSEPGIWEQGAGVVVLDHTLTALAGSVSGLLVAVTYYRLGGWWGTLALPLTVLPVLFLMFTTAWREAPFMPWNIAGSAAYAVSALITLTAAAAFVLLVRRVPIARTES